LQPIAEEALVADARHLHVVASMWTSNYCIQQAETNVVTSALRRQRHQLVVSSCIAQIAFH
jgi:hypothetical protein